jgi:hypothetical protein
MAENEHVRYATVEEAKAALAATQDIRSSTTLPSNNRYATVEEAKAALASREARPSSPNELVRDNTIDLPYAQVPEREPSIIGQLGEDLRNTLTQAPEDVAESTNWLMEGRLDFANYVTQVAGRGVIKPLVGVAGDFITAGSRELWTELPSNVTEPIAGFANDALNWVTNSPTAQTAFHFAKQGYDKYKAWAEINPEDAATFEAIVNVAEIMPIGRGGRFPGVGTNPLNTLERQIAIAEESVRDSVNNYATSIVRPNKSDVSAARVTESRFGTQTVELNDWEASVRDELLNAGLKPRSSDKVNFDIVSAKVDALGVSLKADLEGVPVNPRILDTFMQDNMAGVLERGAFLSRSGDVEYIKAIEDIQRKAMDLFAESDGTAAGLLQARRDLDNYVRELKGDKAFNDPIMRPWNEALKAVRDGLNETIAFTVPDANVRERLLQQSRLLYARTELDDAVGKSWASRLGRAMQHVKNKSGLHVSATPVGVAATMGLASSFATSSIAPFLAVPASLGLGYSVWAGLTGTSARRLIAKTLVGTEKLIEETADPILQNLYIADRVALVEMLSKASENVRNNPEEDTNEPR